MRSREAMPELKSMPEEVISVRGARVHNLKNISVDIPLGKLTVITGVSGSGKSSLAFDTLYAEGQRRYVESLSAYARQFLERMDKPDVDEVIGICPAIAIRQKNSTRNPRSTVATQTEIYDYLRLLFGRAGTTICRQCGSVVKSDSPQSIADEILQLQQGLRFYVLFPASAGVIEREEPKEAKKKPRGKKVKASGAENDAKRQRLKAHIMSLMQRGFTRLYRDGQIIELATPDDFTGASFDGYSVLVDRLAIRPEIKSRLIDSIETCYREGHGQAEIAILATPDVPPPEITVLRFSERFECKKCGIAYIRPEPRLFSFNNPFGACPTCQWFGNVMGLDVNLVIPNPALSLKDGAVEPWTKPQFDWARTELRTFCKTADIPMNVPFNTLTRAQQKMIVDGAPGFDGVKGFFDWLETKKYKLHVRVFLSKYRGYTVCPECGKSRLRQDARDVYVGGANLPRISAMTIAEAADFFDRLTLNPEEAAIADKVLLEIRRRLTFLLDVGLEYLTLDRLAATLSGGEAQRIQLATNLGSALVGALYVLDEPSIGLHPRDSKRLIRILENLRDIGNTVLVVEHDHEMMLTADKIIDVGIGAGELGGSIVFEGTIDELLKSETSLTGRYLNGELEIKTPKNRRLWNPKTLVIEGASEHNLKGIDVEIPLGLMTCITGVSGSGKSTLVHSVIYANLKKAQGEWTEPVGAVGRIVGGENFEEVILVDQSPIGRTPRSNPVTYIKVYDAIRDVFASTREAQSKGFTAAHFSFNVPGGRCERCEGAGVEIKEMQFLADIELVCEECKGARFKSSVLDVRFRGKNINDVLHLTVREAITFFT